MTERRPDWTRPRALSLVALAAFIPLQLSGCSMIDRGGTEEPADGTVEVVSSYGPCWPVYANGVVSLSTNQEGQTLLVSTEKPPGWPEDQTWDSDWRSLNVFAVETGLTRYLARTWDPVATYPVAASPVPGSSAATGPAVVEQMDTVEVARNAAAFVLGTTIEGESTGGYVQVYTGQIPPSSTSDLTPENGLTVVPVNDAVNNEYVRLFEMSDDGLRVATIVGQTGELRVFDVGGEVTVYERTENGVRVRHEVPPVSDTAWTPAYATLGVVHLTWSPDGKRLAMSRAESSGIASLSILDVASGELAEVAQFRNSTVPHVQWSGDGTQLVLMRTPLTGAGTFGNTKFALLEAKKGGHSVSTGEMVRPLGYTSEPALLTRVTDDEYLFDWEGGLWRMTATGGDMGQAQAVRVTQPEQNVPYEPPAGLPAHDKAVFRSLTSRGDGQIGVRDYVSQETCPITEEDQPSEVTPTAEG